MKEHRIKMEVIDHYLTPDCTKKKMKKLHYAGTREKKMEKTEKNEDN